MFPEKSSFTMRMKFPPRKRWTRTEKWLLGAPVLVALFAWAMQVEPDLVRRKRGLPRELPTSATTDVAGIALSRDGTLLAAGGYVTRPQTTVNTVDLWNAKDLRALAPLSRPVLGPSGIDPGTRSVALSPDGRLIAYIASVSTRNLQIFDRHTQKNLWQSPSYVSDFRFSPDGRLALHDSRGTYRIFDAANRRPLTAWRPSPAPGGTALEFSLDGQVLASVAGRPTWKVWTANPNKSGGEIELRDTKTWRIKRTLPLPNTSSIAISPDGTMVAGVAHIFHLPFNANYDGSILRCFSSGNGQLLWQKDTRDKKTAGELRAFSDACFSPDNSSLCLLCYDHLFLLDAKTGQIQRTLSIPANQVSNSSLPHAIAFSPDGKRLFARGKNAVLVWDLE